MKKPKWIVAYYRVSSDEQREKHTIENQRAEGVRYAKVHGLLFDRIYEDDGVSGDSLSLEERPAGSQLMRDAQAGMISEIYALKMDRVGRNARDLLNLRHKLKHLGVTLKFMLEPIPEGDAGELYMQLMASIAEWDRKNLLGNMNRGKRRKASEGGFPGGRVYFGYLKDGKGKLATVVRHETNADILLQIFERVKADESLQVIAEWMTARGVPTSAQNKSSTWQASDVLRIVRNPVYHTGKALWGCTRLNERGERVKVAEEDICKIVYPFLVPQELCEAANAAVDRRAAEYMAHTKTPNLLRGLITCELCGCKFTGRGSGRYYVCIGRHSWKRLGWDKQCKAKLIYQWELLDAVWGLCEMYISNPEKLAEEFLFHSEREDPAQKAAERLRGEEEKLERNSKAREKARIMYQDEMATREEFEKDMRRLQQQRAAIEAEITQLREVTVDAESRENACRSAQTLLEEMWGRMRTTELTNDVKRRIIEALVEGVIVYPDGDYEIKLRFAYSVRDALDRACVRRFSATPARAFEPLTPAQIKAGKDALEVALLPTSASSPKRYLTLSKVISFPGPARALPPAAGPVTPPNAQAKPVATPIHSKTRSGRVTKAAKRA